MKLATEYYKDTGKKVKDSLLLYLEWLIKKAEKKIKILEKFK